MQFIPVKKMNPSLPDDVLPTKGTEGAAGFDLRFAGEEEFVFESGKRAVLPTGIALSIPKGYHGQLWARSGLSVKHGSVVLAGIIDSDYRGEVKVILNNTGDQDWVIKPLDKIAQMVICETPPFSMFFSESLADTMRGIGGFGSTGR